ncbi:structural cement protein Gp24 [Actinobacillus seminis]|uniref:structural cement protein Gp24 n=1 Tax=Actinobacillus seminis TaxID=722 RepID=UPI003B953FE6
MFQNKVNIEQGFGVPGDIHLDSPSRTESLIIDSKGAQQNIVGYAYTKDASTNIAQVGGMIAHGRVFAGILVNSKEYPSYGTVKGALEPSLAVADNTQGDVLTMGDIIVRVTTKCAIGDLVAYDTTTGELSTVAVGGSATEGKALLPNAVVYRYPVTGEGGLTVIRLTN